MAFVEYKKVRMRNDPVALKKQQRQERVFGWQLLEIKESSAADAAYVTVTYQRDKEMEAYSKLCALEREYEALEERLDLLNYQARFRMRNTFDMFSRRDWFLFILFCIVFFPAAFLYMYYVYKKHTKRLGGKNSGWKNEAEMSQLRSRQTALIEQAASLSLVNSDDRG